MSPIPFFMLDKEKLRSMRPWIGLGYFGSGAILLGIFVARTNKAPSFGILFVAVFVVVFGTIVFRIRQQVLEGSALQKVRWQGCLAGVVLFLVCFRVAPYAAEVPGWLFLMLLGGASLVAGRWLRRK
jgi:hypothetical protein